MKVPNSHETIILGIFFLLGNLGNSVCAAFGRAPSSSFMCLYYASVFWAIAAWVIADARRLQRPVPFDMGWFLFLAWPVVLPYHLLNT